MAAPSQAEFEATIEALRDDIELHCETCMYVLDKAGKKVLLKFNRAQRYIHARIEEQRRKIGKVRAIILKGRQQGASTYIGARFYCISSINFGRSAFIVAHEQKATDNLFKMVKRYHGHNPFAPSTSATNSKELVFDKLDGGYKLATAGTADVGRGNTAQVAHLSEFAFWKNAQMHMAGLGNTIADLDDTEIIIESTANGTGGGFHSMWQDAEAGIGEYIAIFVPWFWQDEYRATVPENFIVTAEDQKYMDAYGLDMEQMAWRQNKVITYGQGFDWLFDQEYPATAALAFRSATTDPLISPTSVMAAVNSTYRERTGAFVIGCDPAEYGPDRTAIAFRHGRTVFRIEYHEKKGPMEVAGILAGYYRDMQPDAIFVDKIGIGSGIVDRLKELGVPVIGVNSAARADDPELYANKRAEIWYRFKEWIEDGPNRLPNDVAMIADISAPSYKTSSNGARLIEAKEDMKKRQMRSPDGADAIAMTFAEPVIPRALREDHSRGGGHTQQRAASRAGY
ncbi:hypothetical protein [Massilia antarctica]|uniref:hypothetical protein n=1 Tax=Massilia antarctica TaxID=2765360 RepID=UPI0035E6E6C8